MLNNLDVVTLGLAIVAGIVWLVRLEGLVKINNKSIDNHETRINDVEKGTIDVASILKDIKSDVRMLVNNIKWILKISKIEIPDGVLEKDDDKL